MCPSCYKHSTSLRSYNLVFPSCYKHSTSLRSFNLVCPSCYKHSTSLRSFNLVYPFCYKHSTLLRSRTFYPSRQQRPQRGRIFVEKRSPKVFTTSERSNVCLLVNDGRSVKTTEWTGNYTFLLPPFYSHTINKHCIILHGLVLIYFLNIQF